MKPRSSCRSTLATPVASCSRAVRVVRVTARLNVGGIARHVAWLTGALPAAGYPSLLVTGIVPAGEEDMTLFAAAQGVEPVVIPEMSREISLKDVLTVWKLYRLLRALRPDIVHTHSAKAGAVGRVAGLLYRWLTPATLIGKPRRCRLVHTFHGHIFHSYYGPWKTGLFLLIERILARLATDRIVVISPRQFEEIHRTYQVGRAEQFAVIPLGLDLKTYSEWPARRNILRSELRAGESDILVGIVGRLTEIKNHQLFLQVAALQKKAFPREGRRVLFLVIGDGHLRPRLERQAVELGLDGIVTFMGMRNDPEAFYPALDILALTSLNEGTPLTLIEAMANARAVIATDVGGVADLLGEPLGPGGAEEGYRVCERGVLVREGTASTFFHGLDCLLRDPNLRRKMGERSQHFIEENYSKERLVNDIRQLYDGLLGPQVSEGGEQPSERGNSVQPAATAG